LKGNNVICPPLHTLARLVELSLRVHYPLFPSPRHNFTLPHLRKITVHGTHAQIGGLFRHVDTPALVSAALFYPV
jgi:hypothetical protein